MQQIEILDSYELGIQYIPQLINAFESLKTQQQHKTYLIKKIEELRLVSAVINDLLNKEEVIHSPKRQQSKNKKSRILFSQVDLQVLKQAKNKLESTIKLSLKKHTDLHQQIQSIQSDNECTDSLLIQLDIARLAMIYQSEVEYVNEYFDNIENNPNNLNRNALDTLTQSYQSIIEDKKISIIVAYYLNLNQLIDDLQNLNIKLNQLDEQETNIENSRNTSTNEKHFPIISKSQTFELPDEQRNQILKEITNVDREKKNETCLNCIIF